MTKLIQANSKCCPKLDLGETLSCITSTWIKRITEDTVVFQDGTTASLSDPKREDMKPTIW